MQRCGLLGQKLTHSYSPSIHAAFGGGYSYELFEVEPGELGFFLAQSNFHGLNVTIPYKTAVIPYCKSLSPVAHAIGSVNTIVRQKDGTLYGDNTDAQGFFAMVEHSGLTVRGKKVLVLGSGGSSLTVRYVLGNLGAGEIVVISRNGDHTYENIGLHQDARIIVNTTPVGMYPDTGKAAVELADFPHLEGVLDIIYNPARTRLLMDAENYGIPHVGGLAMLVGQARGSAEMFCGQVIDKDKEAEVINLLRCQMENIILIGMPGSGKTTIGKILAENMDRAFLDADVVIEETSEMTIPEIFEREGEAGFRARETDVLKELGKQSGLVIATGGGCITREENYAHLHQNGTIVFIERDISLLSREGRPLSQNADLSEMYARRLSGYLRFADKIVQNDGDVCAIAKAVQEAALGER